MTRTTARRNGFSLVELMVTITVAAILVAIALPSFRNVIHRNQVTAGSNDVLASLAYARSEAIDRGQMVSMCPSSDGATCTGGQDFASGWMVYTYPAGAASANKAYVAATSLLLRTTTARAGVSIRSKSTEVVTFGQQGQLDSATVTPEPSLTFVTCYTDSTTTTGTSTTAVPGAELDVNGSGSVQTKVVAAGGSCAP